MRTVLLPLLTLAVSVASGQTLGRPRALNLTWRALWQAQAPVRLPVVKDPARERLDLPPLPHADDAVVCVRFQARLHTERPAGWNNYLALVLNGTQVDHKTPEGWPRALNREPLFATTYPNWPQVQLVESRAGLPCLQVFFGPPEPDLKTTLPIEAEEGYWYVLNIDDLVRADAPNTLELVDTALAEYWGDRMPPGLAMIVSDLSVGCVSKTEVAKLQGDLFAPPQRWTGQPALKGPAATVRMTPAGGLQIETGDETWFIESGFSYPAEPAMAFNRLRCGPPGADEWDRRIAREGQALVLQAEAKPYRLRREVRWRNQRLEVADAITNLTDEVLGLAVEHSIITPQPPRVVRLGGLDEYARGAGTCPENPTVFAAQGKSGVGLVAEDDAMRLQMSTLAMVNQVRLRTDRLGLAPEETYTLRWAVYPGSTDYFDFINALRRDWDVNYTVEGPFDFFSVRQLDSEEGRAAAKALLARKHLKLFALVPWFEYYSGWPYTRDQYREMMTRAIAFIHEAVPGAKCLACTETNLVPVPLTFFGDTIPAEGWPIGRDKGGKYGQPATPAMTAKVDASPWRDSCIRDASGNVVLDCWYVQYYTEPPGLNLMVYPEIGNHRHANMLEQLTWLLDEVGFDGVYIDQFSMAYSTGADRFSRERWDGRTVTLDPAGRVQSKMADLGLVSAPARAQWVKLVLDRGKTVVCNSHPVVKELQSLRTFRFMETQGYDPLTPADGPPLQPGLARGQLHSPIGLGHGFPSAWGADAFMRTVIAHLRFGILYYYYGTSFPPEGERGGEFGPVNVMFPFTPIELHEGWVLGEERLLTCVSGTFPWPHAQAPRVLLFDSRGREKPAEAKVERKGKGHQVTISLKDWWEVAVVLPAEAQD